MILVLFYLCLCLLMWQTRRVYGVLILNKMILVILGCKPVMDSSLMVYPLLDPIPTQCNQLILNKLHLNHWIFLNLHPHKTQPHPQIQPQLQPLIQAQPQPQVQIQNNQSQSFTNTQNTHTASTTPMDNAGHASLTTCWTWSSTNASLIKNQPAPTYQHWPPTAQVEKITHHHQLPPILPITVITSPQNRNSVSNVSVTIILISKTKYVRLWTHCVEPTIQIMENVWLVIISMYLIVGNVSLIDRVAELEVEWFVYFLVILLVLCGVTSTSLFVMLRINNQINTHSQKFIININPQSHNPSM